MKIQTCSIYYTQHARNIRHASTESYTCTTHIPEQLENTMEERWGSKLHFLVIYSLNPNIKTNVTNKLKPVLRGAEHLDEILYYTTYSRFSCKVILQAFVTHSRVRQMMDLRYELSIEFIVPHLGDCMFRYFLCTYIPKYFFRSEKVLAPRKKTFSPGSLNIGR